MIAVIHSKTELMELVNMETSYLSNPIGKIEENVAMRLPELIPLTEDHSEIFNRLVNKAAKEIATKLAPYSKGIKIPFIVTHPNDAFPQKDSTVFTVNIYDDQENGIIVPKLEDAIRTALVHYVTKEWLKFRGYVDFYKLYETNWPEILQEVKNTMEFGHKVTRTYRTIN